MHNWWLSIQMVEQHRRELLHEAEQVRLLPEGETSAVPRTWLAMAGMLSLSLAFILGWPR